MGEFKQIVKDTLRNKNFSQANLESEACCEILAEEVEKNIKAKFHIFRINKIITGDCPKPDNH